MRRAACVNNLRQISLALQGYHDKYGSFPPAYIADEQGRAMHSWRVLILPWLDKQEIYDRYRFDEPWDGPNNRKLHDAVVPVYWCPNNPKQGRTTAFVAVVGKATAWRGAEPVSLDEMTDGPEDIIQLVETLSPSIHWMEPRDLEFNHMSFTINDPKGAPGLASTHPYGVNVVKVSAYVKFLNQRTTPNELRAMLTIAGGEKIGDDD